MWQQIRSNKTKTVFLVFFMLALLCALGFVLAEAAEPGAGPAGVAIAASVWFVQLLISYFAGDSIFLSMSGARQIEPKDHPRLFNIVEEMKIASGLSVMPKIYIIDDVGLNAFATGRNEKTAAVAVTSGLLEKLNRDELQGVIAHELGHVNNRDILFMMVAGTMMGAIVLLADIGVRSLRTTRRRTSSKDSGQVELVMLVVALTFMILAPILAQLLYFSLSRRREYLADACSALYTRYPEGLASALEKISGGTAVVANASRVMAPMFIISPLKNWASLSSTHPPTVERIKILRSMAGGASYTNYNVAFQQVTNSKKNLIGASSLVGEQEVAIRQTATSQDLDVTDRRRETTDVLWKLNDYIFIACECGTNLKAPPEFSGQNITCPHCQREHLVSASTKG